MPIEPDTKDWTWVLDEACPDCGFDAREVSPSTLATLTRANVLAWQDALGHQDAAVRPADNVWSTLEYGCHVRDVHRLFSVRVQQMLDQDNPLFANWDQDQTAVEDCYSEQNPTAVGEELAQAAERVAQQYAEITGDQWDRPGRRSNGSAFTIATLGQYHLHDVIHHTHDVSQ